MFEREQNSLGFKRWRKKLFSLKRQSGFLLSFREINHVQDQEPSEIFALNKLQEIHVEKGKEDCFQLIFEDHDSHLRSNDSIHSRTLTLKASCVENAKKWVESLSLVIEANNVRKIINHGDINTVDTTVNSCEIIQQKKLKPGMKDYYVHKSGLSKVNISSPSKKKIISQKFVAENKNREIDSSIQKTLNSPIKRPKRRIPFLSGFQTRLINLLLEFTDKLPQETLKETKNLQKPALTMDEILNFSEKECDLTVFKITGDSHRLKEQESPVELEWNTVTDLANKFSSSIRISHLISQDEKVALKNVGNSASILVELVKTIRYNCRILQLLCELSLEHARCMLLTLFLMLRNLS